MVGIPTVLLSLRPKNSLEMGPPRVITPTGFALGDCFGNPHNPELQREVLLDVLGRWAAREEPGLLWERSYTSYVRNPLITHDGEIIAED